MMKQYQDFHKITSITSPYLIIEILTGTLERFDRVPFYAEKTEGLF